MPKISNFKQAHKELRRFVPNSLKLGSYSLDRMQRLMAKLGNPQDSLKIIHVAGTSGKTSTCYYITALLQAAGKKVGLTVSPHVDEVNERVQINLKPLDERHFCQSLGEFIDIINQTKLEPTYFELLVAFAYWLFAKEQVDYAVIEVGLGGLLDGTNVVNRPDKVCVITDIGLDHTSVLGNSLGEIATQKAGIIQDHNPVVMFKQDGSVMQAVEQRCMQKHAQLHTLALPAVNHLPANLPPFQQRNWYLAKQVYDLVAERDKLTKLNQEQLSQTTDVTVPARMEVVHYHGKTIIIDGSHNGQKMSALVEGVKKQFPQQSVAALVGFVSSEQNRAPDALKELKDITGPLIVTSFSEVQDTPKRSVEPTRIAQMAKELGPQNVTVVKDPTAAFQALLEQPEDVLLVTGSFYLLNHIRPLIFKT